MGKSPPPEPRRHHYVPRLLLKGFGVERKPGRFQTQVFDKHTGRVFKAAIEDVMVERDFNALEIDGNRVSVEDLLGEFEKIAAPIIDIIINDGSLRNLTEQNRLELARFAALQFIRGTGHREMFDDMSRKIASEIENRGFELNERTEFTSEEIKAHGIVAIMKSLPEYASILAIKDMILLSAPPADEFILGDNPVALHNDEPRGFYGNMGLACRGIQVHLPISSKYTLAFWCPTIQEKLLTRLKEAKSVFGTLRAKALLGVRPFEISPDVLAKYEVLINRLVSFENAFLTGDAHISDSENVLHFNSLQVRHAERFIISESGRFDLPREMIAHDDRYKRGPRMNVN